MIFLEEEEGWENDTKFEILGIFIEVKFKQAYICLGLFLREVC
jgi:hypothetical protein